MKIYIILFLILGSLWFSQYFQSSIKEGMSNQCENRATVIKNAGNIKRISALTDKLNKDMNNIKLQNERMKSRLGALTKRLGVNDKTTKQTYERVKEHQEIIEDMSRQAQQESEQLQQESDKIEF